MKQNRGVTSDGVKILFERYFAGRPREIAALDDERLKSDIAQQIYDLRTAARLSQRALAARIGTTASVISRLEDTNYTAHSVSMLRRIAKAFGWRVDVRFVPATSKRFALSKAWRRTVEKKRRGMPAARNGRGRGAVA